MERIELKYRNMATDLLTVVTTQVQELLEVIGKKEMQPDLKLLDILEKEML